MNMYKIGSLGIVAAVIAGGLWYVFTVVPRSAPWEEHGTLVILAQAFPEPGARATSQFETGVDSIILRENGVDVPLSHSTANVTLPLNNSLLHNILTTDVHTGTYEELVFTLDTPTLVDTKDDSPLKTQLSSPTYTISLSIPFELRSEETVVVILGFETLRALHTTSDATTVFLPVIHTEVRDGATVTTPQSGEVSVTDGTIVHNTLFGMDWDGSLRKNFRAK